MTTREKALLASSPGITLLVVALGWWVIDPKGDARQHVIDRGVRLLDSLRI